MSRGGSVGSGGLKAACLLVSGVVSPPVSVLEPTGLMSGDGDDDAGGGDADLGDGGGDADER